MIETMSNDIHQHRILILDFGSQYTQLIARRVREIGVYCEIWPWDASASDIIRFAPRGFILSGGPESVHAEDGPQAPEVVFELDVPVLGICYGLHTMAAQLGGTVAPSSLKEFGFARGELVAIKVDDAAGSLRLIEKVLKGEHCAARDIVLLNAGAAIYVAGLVDSIQAGVIKAKEVVDDGGALVKWRALVDFNK